MKNVFIINPVAGKGNLQNGIIDSIKEYFSGKKEEFEIYISKKRSDAEEFARRLALSGERYNIFACGGEGTFYEVLNGAIGHDNVSLGVIPCGSANDFLKHFKNRNAFLDIAAQVGGSKTKMDVIKAGDRYCINGCSVGMDAIVARDMSIFKNWPLVSGKMAYNLAIIKTFIKKIGVKIKITLDDGKPFDANCLFAVVANAPYYGGGYMAAPGAQPDDGRLNFTLVDTISKLKVPGFLKRYEKGAINDLSYCKLDLCEKMSFTADKLTPVNLDGEIIESKSMDFSIVKKAVSFIVPDNADK